MSLAESVSRNLRTLRESAGISQNQLAQRTGVSLRYISNLENDAPNVTVDVIERLAQGLDCAPALFLGGEAGIKHSPKAAVIIDQAIRLLKALKTMMRRPGERG